MVKRTERLQGSKKRCDDEYYTLFQDIADELSPYAPQLRGKRILCPCDLKYKLSVKYIKERSIWLQHKDAIYKEVNDFMKSEDYRLSESKDADIEAMILGIVGNKLVDPKRLFTQDDK